MTDRTAPTPGDAGTPIDYERLATEVDFIGCHPAIREPIARAVVAALADQGLCVLRVEDVKTLRHGGSIVTPDFHNRIDSAIALAAAPGPADGETED